MDTPAWPLYISQNELSPWIRPLKSWLHWINFALNVSNDKNNKNKIQNIFFKNCAIENYRKIIENYRKNYRKIIEKL